MPRLTYTPAEVAQMIGTSEWWVRDQVRHHRVSHLRLGKCRIALRDTDIPQLLALVEVPAQIQPEDPPEPDYDDLTLIGLSPHSLALHRC